MSGAERLDERGIAMVPAPLAEKATARTIGLAALPDEPLAALAENDGGGIGRRRSRRGLLRRLFNIYLVVGG